MTFVRTPPAAGLAASAYARSAAASYAPRPAPHARPVLARAAYETLDVDVDARRGIFWCRLRPAGRPCFSPGMLRDVGAMHRALRQLFEEGSGPAAASALPRYFVCASDVPGIFNLGGDLGLFQALIAAGDIEGLKRYGRTAVELIHRNHVAFDLPLVTVALVQGDALGGGFECALSHDVIVAERSAKFGLPEVLFNLFPGMGAYSFLSRRIGRAAAERMILGGRIHTAEELHELGLVDVVAPDGEGEDALLEHLDKNDRWRNARHATYRARRRVDPVTLQELVDVVEVWAEAAMGLGEQDLRRMARLAAAQDRRIAAQPRPAAALAH